MYWVCCSCSGVDPGSAERAAASATTWTACSSRSYRQNASRALPLTGE